MLTISAFTVFEIMEGVYRVAEPGAEEKFVTEVLPGFDIIYPDQEIFLLGARINAALANNP